MIAKATMMDWDDLLAYSIGANAPQVRQVRALTGYLEPERVNQSATLGRDESSDTPYQVCCCTIQHLA